MVRLKKQIIKDFSLSDQRKFIAEIAPGYAKDRYNQISLLENELREIVKDFKGKTVLELGAGGGAVLAALKNLGIDAIGVEVVREMIKEATALNIKSIIHADSTNLPFQSDSFDLVLLWGNTLGPIPGRVNRIALLKEVQRVIKTEGKLIVNVINRSASIRRRLQPLEYLFHYKSRSDESYSQSAGYNRFYTFKQLKSELSEAGFTRYKKLSKLSDSALIVQAQ